MNKPMYKRYADKTPVAVHGVTAFKCTLMHL